MDTKEKTEGHLFIISAPSGAGKSSIVKALVEKCAHACPFKRVVTYTTRPQREGELDGIDYHFISVDEFKEKITKNFFMEWSTWYDHYYGSPLSIIEEVKHGYSYIMILDRSGAREVKRFYPETVLIWIEPPSLKVLEERLIKRGKNTSATIKSRLQKAAIEIEQEKQERTYDFHVVNDDFFVAIEEIMSIITKKMKKN